MDIENCSTLLHKRLMVCKTSILGKKDSRIIWKTLTSTYGCELISVIIDYNTGSRFCLIQCRSWRGGVSRGPQCQASPARGHATDGMGRDLGEGSAGVGRPFDEWGWAYETCKLQGEEQSRRKPVREKGGQSRHMCPGCGGLVSTNMLTFCDGYIYQVPNVGTIPTPRAIEIEIRELMYQVE